jgi:hypothetical protein
MGRSSGSPKPITSSVSAASARTRATYSGRVPLEYLDEAPFDRRGLAADVGRLAERVLYHGRGQ